jgi:flagellar basal-body rod protein FlgB
VLGKLGNKNMDLLGKMLSLHGARHRVLAQNIANVNTPNYRRREFRFDTALSQALQNGAAEDYRQIKGYVARPNTTPVRNNGNNVAIDEEMLDMGRNSLSYDVYGQLYTRKAQALKSAIKGGR